MDDLLIFSKSVEDHYEHLGSVLKRLSQNELYGGNDKCDFFNSETEVLGLNINGK